MELLENVHVKNLASILKEIGETVEGNLICDKTADHFILDENLDKIKNLQYLVRDKKKICEIGVNAGHSLLIMLLENPEAEYLLFDLNCHAYTIPCLKYIASVFPNTKMSLMTGDSTKTIVQFLINNKDALHQYDLCHIDGGHTYDVFSADFHNVKYLSKMGCPVIFDDSDNEHIDMFLKKNVAQNNISEYEDPNIINTDKHFVYSYKN
uniref:Methyltransferase n=1 Tax=viral metagenome TaxID=1070528 RepID=A0A6C0B2Z6_9ZZZZ